MYDFPDPGADGCEAVDGIVSMGRGFGDEHRL